MLHYATDKTSYKQWVFDLKQLLRNVDKTILLPHSARLAQLYNSEYTATEAFGEIIEQGS